MKLELKRGEIPDHLLKYFKPVGHKAKDIVDTPHMLSEELRRDGWYFRSEIIWHKPNPMPESVTDRPTKSHEYVFLLTKKPNYWYDADAIREPGSESRPWGTRENVGQYKDNQYAKTNGSLGVAVGESGRNARTVWTIATEPNSFAHFATFPQKLIEPMILAGCPDKTCAVCGAPWVRVVEASGGTIGKSWHNHENDLEAGMTQTINPGGGIGNSRNSNGQLYTRETKGFEPTCSCNAATRPGLTLDPFMGSGTTALVARAHGRNYIGSELNIEYVNIARERLRTSAFEQHYIERESAPLEDLPMFAAGQ